MAAAQLSNLNNSISLYYNRLHHSSTTPVYPTPIKTISYPEYNIQADPAA